MTWKQCLLSCAGSLFLLASLAGAQTPRNLGNNEVPGSVRCVTADGTAYESCGGSGVSPSGSGFYEIKRTDVANVSVTISFGFTAKKVAIAVPLSNSDEVCIDWLGSTAVCPSANTAGDGRYAPGDAMFQDNVSMAAISVIAASGTQTIYVRAWQ